MRRLRRHNHAWSEEWVGGWVCKVDNRFGYEKWLQGGCIGGRVGLQKLITDLDRRNGYKGGVRVGFIYIKDMYNNDVGKGGV
jgi:hypothetical protein